MNPKEILYHHLFTFGSEFSQSRVEFCDLSYAQRSMIANGCGPRGWGAIPDWGFTQACDEHDFAYWRGGTAEDRKKADRALFEEMLYEARLYKNPIRRWFRRAV